MGKGWTEERRRAQAERCRANKPWDQSTGPKTPEGKARASMNAFKHGGDTRLIALTKDILKHNRAFLKAYKELVGIELKKPLEKQLLIWGWVAEKEKSD